MEFSMRSYAVVSLLLLASLSTDMSGPLVADARGCDPILCLQYCRLQGLPACCGGPIGQCFCTPVCPPIVKKEITEEVLAGATVEEPFIKEVVIA